HMQQAAQEIGQRVNKALDEYQGQSPIRGVTDKPTKAKADELEPPKGNELPGSAESQRETLLTSGPKSVLAKSFALFKEKTSEVGKLTFQSRDIRRNKFKMPYTTAHCYQEKTFGGITGKSILKKLQEQNILAYHLMHIT
ncbi:hypothetical protein JQ508_12320, partial [Pseudoalteromonas sp. JC3]|nr:hypothetical protein [Pseudoalteromonas sp. JC3]